MSLQGLQGFLSAANLVYNTPGGRGALWAPPAPLIGAYEKPGGACYLQAHAQYVGPPPAPRVYAPPLEVQPTSKNMLSMCVLPLTPPPPPPPTLDEGVGIGA